MTNNKTTLRRKRKELQFEYFEEGEPITFEAYYQKRNHNFQKILEDYTYNHHLSDAAMSRLVKEKTGVSISPSSICYYRGGDTNISEQAFVALQFVIQFNTEDIDPLSFHHADEYLYSYPESFSDMLEDFERYKEEYPNVEFDSVRYKKNKYDS